MLQIVPPILAPAPGQASAELTLEIVFELAQATARRIEKLEHEVKVMQERETEQSALHYEASRRIAGALLQTTGVNLSDLMKAYRRR